MLLNAICVKNALIKSPPVFQRLASQSITPAYFFSVFYFSFISHVKAALTCEIKLK